MMTRVRGSSNAKAKRELGWQPRWPTWREGVPPAPDSGETGTLTTEQLYGDLRPLMFSIAYRMLGQVTEAEDIVQEAFLRYYRAMAGLGPAGLA